MKLISTLPILLWMTCLNAQTTFPGLLQGTWQVENQDVFERWDSLNEHTLKGISYSQTNDKIHVIEYLDIRRHGQEILYSATVPGQNNGNSIVFTLTDTTQGFVFENPEHDFPKRIVYRLFADSAIFVEVSDGLQKGFSYTIIKQKSESGSKDTSSVNPNYDHGLARKLEADDYGMKRYMLVVLKTGASTNPDKTFVSECFRGHMDNINRLVEAGKLVVAGPLGKNDRAYRGIFILDVSTQEEAELLLQSDPAIKEGLLDAEIFSWYGSAALPEYLDASEKIWKKKP